MFPRRQVISAAGPCSNITFFKCLFSFTFLHSFYSLYAYLPYHSRIVSNLTPYYFFSLFTFLFTSLHTFPTAFLIRCFTLSHHFFKYLFPSAFYMNFLISTFFHLSSLLFTLYKPLFFLIPIYLLSTPLKLYLLLHRSL